MPALQVDEAPKRKTPPPMPAMQIDEPPPPPILAVSSQAMAPVVESTRASTAPATASEQISALATGSNSAARRLPLPGVDEIEPETEIDPLASRQGEVSQKSPSIWNKEETFEPDEPSVVVRSKSLVLEALAAEAARHDAEDAREEAEPPTRVDGANLESRADSNAQTFAEQTEIDDGPTGVARDASAMDDGPTSVMSDNSEPIPASWGARTAGPPERGSQEIITPLPPPPMMPEITDYPRVRRTDPVMPLAAPVLSPTQTPGWMPAAPTVDARPMSNRKKWMIAGGIGAVLLVAILVFAMRGGDEPTKAATGSDSIEKNAPDKIETPTPTETAPTETTPTETPTETGTATPTPPPDKTTPRPTKKPPKVSSKPPPKKAPVKKPPPKKAPVKKPPPKKEPAGWDPNSLFPKKK